MCCCEENTAKCKERIHCVAIDEAHCIEEWLVYFFVVPLFSYIKLLCVYFHGKKSILHL